MGLGPTTLPELGDGPTANDFILAEIRVYGLRPYGSWEMGPTPTTL